jgi:hypothetical protein
MPSLTQGDNHIGVVLAAKITSGYPHNLTWSVFHLLELSVADQVSKAELLHLKCHPFICMKNLTNKKVGNRKNYLRTFRHDC